MTYLNSCAEGKSSRLPFGRNILTEFPEFLLVNSILAGTAVLQLLWWHSIFLSSYWLTNFVRISRVPIGVQYTSLNSCAEVKAQGYPAFFLADTFYQNFRSFYWWILSEQLTHSVKISRAPIGGPVQLCWSDDTTISRLPIGRYIFSEFLLGTWTAVLKCRLGDV